MSARRYTDAQKELALYMREHGQGVERIARDTGLTRGQVSYLCLKHGAIAPQQVHRNVKRVTAMRNGHVVRPFTEEEDKKLLEMEAAGMGIAAMSKALGRRHNSCHGRLMTLARQDELIELGRVA